MKKLILVLAFSVIAAFSATCARAAEIDSAAKYKLQSVFIYNFISSVTWPKITYSDNVKNIDLCIVGKDTLGGVIDLIAKKAESKGNVKIQVRRGVTASNVETCNIAYISSSEDASGIIAKTKDLPILTVSEISGFSKAGGVIEFVLKGSSVGFNVNNKNAKKVGLKIDPQLMEAAAEVVE